MIIICEISSKKDILSTHTQTKYALPNLSDNDLYGHIEILTASKLSQI